MEYSSISTVFFLTGRVVNPNLVAGKTFNTWMKLGRELLVWLKQSGVKVF